MAAPRRELGVAAGRRGSTPRPLAKAPPDGPAEAPDRPALPGRLRPRGPEGQGTGSFDEVAGGASSSGKRLPRSRESSQRRTRLSAKDSIVSEGPDGLRRIDPDGYAGDVVAVIPLRDAPLRIHLHLELVVTGDHVGDVQP